MALVALDVIVDRLVAMRDQADVTANDYNRSGDAASTAWFKSRALAFDAALALLETVTA